ncbi:MAG: orotidine 5'-phosphate decarboxylase [Euryarchaeota archaeon RBG_16_68_13]|nr:MAG: orotidine 5'-phosphate decarboxylase [Euryarchaeota archaeon RBG_16_68_13]
MRIEHGLILALDVTDPAKALRIARAVHGKADAVKVGWPLVLAGGLEAVRSLASHDYVLCDFKIADIPNTNRLIVEQAVSAGASGVVCHAFAGEDSVRACVDAAGGADVFVVTEMSHPGGAAFMAGHAEDFARSAVDAGAAGIVAPATRPERVRVLKALLGSRFLLAPGVGAQGGSPADAIRAGADAIIVGRGIYESSDPGRAATELGLQVAEARRPR